MSDEVLLKLLVIKTHDMPTVRRFYAALGLEFVEERHGAGPLHYAAKIGEMVLEIYPLADGKAADDSLRLGFAVANLEERLTGLADAGGKVLKPLKETPWGPMALVADPDGRRVELYRHVDG